MTYSMDFRRRVNALYEEGMQTSEIVEVMGCSASWARRLKQRERETGTLEATKPRRQGKRIYQADDERRIAALIQEKPDATLAEVVEALGKPASLATACRTLTRLDLPRKKSPPEPASRTGPTSPQRGRTGSRRWDSSASRT
jgi:transposase